MTTRRYVIVSILCLYASEKERETGDWSDLGENSRDDKSRGAGAGDRWGRGYYYNHTI